MRPFAFDPLTLEDHAMLADQRMLLQLADERVDAARMRLVAGVTVPQLIGLEEFRVLEDRFLVEPQLVLDEQAFDVDRCEILISSRLPAGHDDQAFAVVALPSPQDPS